MMEDYIDYSCATPKDNPDYPHSHTEAGLKTYIENVRLAERMM